MPSDPKLPPGSNFCKCAPCGEYFTSPYTFDMHRAGSPTARFCQKPGAMLDKHGKPRLRLNGKGYWASNKEKPRHWERHESGNQTT